MTNTNKSSKCYSDLFFKQLSLLEEVPDGDIQFRTIFEEKEVGLIFKKKIKKEAGKYILRKGNYISLRGICSYIQDFLIILNDANNNFYKSLENAVLGQEIVNYNCNLKENILDINYEDIFIGDLKLTIDFSKLPKILSDSLNVYSKIKGEVYKYLRFVNSYKDFLKFIEKDITVLENITFKIEKFEIDAKSIIVKLNFDNYSLYEVKITEKDFKICTFSKDLVVDIFLDSNKNNIFEKIFIEECKLGQILEICSLIGCIGFIGG